MKKLPEITVHGRFQPPLHINHWEYVREGFARADLVTILITNPNLDESFDKSASWRNDPNNNPFDYDERVQMFCDFFEAKNILPEQYRFIPFNIKDDKSFTKLNKRVPNLVNVYSEWSAKKADAFRSHDLEVIQLNQPKLKPVSGTYVRRIITDTKDKSQLSSLLIEAGLMPEAVPGLMRVLSTRHIQT